MAFSFILNKMVNSIMARKWPIVILIFWVRSCLSAYCRTKPTIPLTQTRSIRRITGRRIILRPRTNGKTTLKSPFFRGKYHYYYLYNRDYPNGNGTEWRHAVSEDLVHWTDEGTAIPKYTNENGDIWSGSVVIDKHNTAGFGKTRWSPSQRSRQPKQKPRNNIYGTARIKEKRLLPIVISP